MFLKELNIINFKNISTRQFSFSDKINCFVGNNGVGKTNILDAVHYLSLCKSGLGLSDKMCIRHGEAFFMVEGEYIITERRHENIVVSYNGKNKSIKRNTKEYSKIAEHIGLLPFVMVSPYDTGIINESGDERRRFLNSFISQIDPIHMSELMSYNTLITQRNKILKTEIIGEAQDVLEIIDMQIVTIANSICKRRKEIIEELAPLVESYYHTLSGEKEEVTLRYSSQLLKKPMDVLLEEALERDKIMGYTTVGTHRDDIKMSIMDYPIRRYGSQGQQKSFLIALKLAQYDILFAHVGRKPILLLDDIFDKLDLERVAELIGIVSGDHFGQIFISDCNKQRLKTILDKIDTKHKIFDIE